LAELKDDQSNMHEISDPKENDEIADESRLRLLGKGNRYE